MIVSKALLRHFTKSFHTENISRRFIQIITSVQEMGALVNTAEYNPMQSLGFVPTMGALHKGHMELVREAKQNNDKVISSIFVNPAQFTQGEDLDRYPRQLERDTELLMDAGVDYLFAPSSVAEMYDKNRLVHVEPAAFLNIYEGKSRPEFFRGVATICCKLFNIVRPNYAYFGQKDIGQCILVRRLVADLNMPLKIFVRETIRESTGLALSSRNAYLTEEEKHVAPILYKALLAAKTHCEGSDSQLTRAEAVSIAEQMLKKEPKVAEIEYISFASHINMQELDDYNPAIGAVISSAIRVGSGKVRLIDNLLIGPAEDDVLGSS